MEKWLLILEQAKKSKKHIYLLILWTTTTTTTNINRKQSIQLDRNNSVHREMMINASTSGWALKWIALIDKQQQV